MVILGVIWYVLGKYAKPLGFLSKYTSVQMAGWHQGHENTLQKGHQKHCAYQVLGENVASVVSSDSCDPNKSQIEL